MRSSRQLVATDGKVLACFCGFSAEPIRN